jgi:hypothetical protein
MPTAGQRAADLASWERTLLGQHSGANVTTGPRSMVLTADTSRGSETALPGRGANRIVT